MDDLAYSLKTMAARVADGSHATRANRHRGLQAMAGELERPSATGSQAPLRLNRSISTPW